MYKIKYKNHKIIGKKLQLFFFYKNLNNGLPIWLPNGIYMYNKIKKIIYNINKKNKYLEVLTPNIVNYSIYKKSGHLEKYRDNIYKIVNKKKIYLKPMNCPYHCLIYKFFSNLSYKKLPLKLFEFGTVFRNEKSGELNGLFRTKIFTQDDGHIFCKDIKQLINEINNIINIIFKLYKIFKFKNIKIQLSYRDKKNNSNYIGKNKYWKKSENILKKILNKKKIKYYIVYGESAFYGPKIDFFINDINNRKWQLSTIQIDFNTPKRFQLKYYKHNNKIGYPIIIHRALLGSIERFIGILLENGKIPFFLFKIQVIILPIFKTHYTYSKKIYNYLKKKKIKIKIDKNKTNLNEKIKKYEKLNIPIILIIGDKELYSNTVIIRTIKNKNKKIKFKNVFKYIFKYIYNK
ncbi:MAG: threonine--tRNA ligase [Candidatus Shikimatogenerans sp. JK-2022]|nr:threonine--tRNA ligase [Candidatus Shikimatogenerans bostrichidophilus]